MKKLIFIFIFAFLSISTYAQEIIMGIDMAKPIENAVLILNKNDYTLNTKHSNDSSLIFNGKLLGKNIVITVEPKEDNTIKTLTYSLVERIKEVKYIEVESLYLKLIHALNSHYYMVDLHSVVSDPIEGDGGELIYAKSAAKVEGDLFVVVDFYKTGIFYCVCVYFTIIDE